MRRLLVIAALVVAAFAGIGGRAPAERRRHAPHRREHHGHRAPARAGGAGGRDPGRRAARPRQPSRERRRAARRAARRQPVGDRIHLRPRLRHLRRPEQCRVGPRDPVLGRNARADPDQRGLLAGHQRRPAGRFGRRLPCGDRRLRRRAPAGRHHARGVVDVGRAGPLPRDVPVRGARRRSLAGGLDQPRAHLPRQSQRHPRGVGGAGRRRVVLCQRRRVRWRPTDRSTRRTDPPAPSRPCA